MLEPRNFRGSGAHAQALIATALKARAAPRLLLGLGFGRLEGLGFIFWVQGCFEGGLGSLGLYPLGKLGALEGLVLVPSWGAMRRGFQHLGELRSKRSAPLQVVLFIEKSPCQKQIDFMCSNFDGFDDSTRLLGLSPPGSLCRRLESHLHAGPQRTAACWARHPRISKHSSARCHLKRSLLKLSLLKLPLQSLEQPPLPTCQALFEPPPARPSQAPLEAPPSQASPSSLNTCWVFCTVRKFAVIQMMILC